MKNEKHIKNNNMRGGVLFLGILFGTVLMVVLVYCLPTSPMKDNIKHSAEMYEHEGTYPQLMWGYYMSQ